MNDSTIKESERKGESKNLLTVTGSKAKIKGQIDVDESIDINCDIEGEVKVEGKLIIQKDGYVKAEVNTQDAVVSGRFEGNMKVNGRVEVTKKGILKGNITTDRIVINEGGIFSGTVTRISDDKKQKEKNSVPKANKKKVVKKKVVEKKEKEELNKIGDFNFDYERKI